MHYTNKELSKKIFEAFHDPALASGKFWYKQGSEIFIASPVAVDYKMAEELSPAYSVNEILMPEGILATIAKYRETDVRPFAETFIDLWHTYGWQSAEEYLTELISNL